MMAERKAASSDGSTPVTDAPPKPEVVEEDLSNKPGIFEAVAPMQPVQPLPADADFVQYKGLAQERRMTEAQWQQARVDDQGEVVWNKANGFKVPLRDLSDKALLALARDNSFAMPDRS